MTLPAEPPEQRFAAPYESQPMGTAWPAFQPSEPIPANFQPPRAHRTRTAVVAVVALAVAFGAGLVAGRATAPKAATGPSAISSAVAATSAPSGSGSPAAGSTASLAALTTALIPVPSGGKARTAPGAGSDGSLTLDQYLKLLYPNSTDERSLLQARGFTGAATRWMNTASAQEISVYLVGFNSQDGAQSYALALISAHKDAADADQTQFAVPAFTDGVGFETAALDSYGNTDSYVYGSIGKITVIVHCFTPAKLDRAALLALVDQQSTLLAAYRG